MKIAAALLIALPAISPAQQIAIATYPLPYSISAPSLMTPGVNDAVWFVDGPYIGQVTPAGQITQFPTPPPWDVYSVTAGPDGAMWYVPAIPFGATGGPKIGRMTTAGATTEYPLPDPNSYPQFITKGPDGALWFTDLGTNMIGRITTAGAVTEYLVPTPVAGLGGIRNGPDGALWFTEANAIGRITTAGVVTEYPLPNPDSGCCSGITEGPDGAMWFTEGAVNDAIGRIAANGTITQFPVTSNFRPQSITAGPDGALWFTNSNSPNLGRITTAGAVSYYPSGASSGIALGHDGELWFTTAIGNGGVYTPGVICEVVFETASLTVTPDTGYVGSNLDFTGTGFGPNEPVHIYTAGVGSSVLASTTADATGSIAVSAHASPSPYLFGNPRIFLGLGQTTGNLGAASFNVKARLSLSPSSGPPGSAVTVSGSGFGPFEDIRVLWNNPTTLLGAVSADVNGTFTGSTAVQFTVPAGAAPGAYRVFGNNLYGGANGSGSFTVP
jgi:virginiamycin B lyase